MSNTTMLYKINRKHKFMFPNDDAVYRRVPGKYNGLLLWCEDVNNPGELLPIPMWQTVIDIEDHIS